MRRGRGQRPGSPTPLRSTIYSQGEYKESDGTITRWKYLSPSSAAGQALGEAAIEISFEPKLPQVVTIPVTAVPEMLKILQDAIKKKDRNGNGFTYLLRGMQLEIWISNQGANTCVWNVGLNGDNYVQYLCDGEVAEQLRSDLLQAVQHNYQDVLHPSVLAPADDIVPLHERLLGER